MDVSLYCWTRDVLVSIEVNNRIVHKHHSFLSWNLKNWVHMLRFSADDKISNRIIIKHDFACDDSSTSIGSRKKCLRNDSCKSESKLHTDLILLIWRERLDDTINRLDSIIGMECRKDEMSCLGKCDSCLDSGKVSHFSDDNDIRILTENWADSIRESIKLFSKLSLMNKRFFILIDKFYWIFKSHNMSLGITIDVLDHSRHSRRFSTSCWTSDKNNSFFCKCKIENMIGKIDRLRLWDKWGNHTKSDCRSANDTRNIYTKTCRKSLKRYIDSSISERVLPTKCVVIVSISASVSFPKACTGVISPTLFLI